MNLHQNRQAMLLLTCELNTTSATPKPLSVAEWKRFAEFLRAHQKQPADCLLPDAPTWLQNWNDPKKSDNPITYERLLNLLDRGNELAFAMERWDRAGIWVITRSQLEQHYPRKLKQLLGQNAPPVLFGCGNLALLNDGSKRLAVVGSRHASREDLEYAYTIGQKAAQEQIVIVSGGAKGIDEATMQGATQQQGNIIGVIADSLLHFVTAQKWRDGLRSGRSVFISPFNPEARFNKFNAMARNDYIYGLSDSSLVVHSGKKGGTFSGAEKNLKKNWIPLWVNQETKDAEGNQTLIQLGGIPISDLLSQSLHLLFEEITPSPEHIPTQIGLFSEDVEDETLEISPKKEEVAIPIKHQLYQVFINHISQHYLQSFMLKQLKEDTDLPQSQLKEWLELAVEEGKIKRSKNHYQVV